LAALFFGKGRALLLCILVPFAALQTACSIRAPNLKIVLVNFALSFGNFRAVHMCRLIWRQCFEN
jgi:hypothetical protein